MKVLLINPQTPNFIEHKDKYIHVGLLYLASTLEKNGNQVQIIDVDNDLSNIQPENIINYYSNTFINKLTFFKPDIIGIGVLFSGRFKSALKISQIIKKCYPTIPIVLGGIHPTIFPKEILKDYSFIDYIILGEGEYSFKELIEVHFKDIKLIKNINGIAYRYNGEIIVNEKTKFIDDLDSLPFPAYNLINLTDYYFDTSNWVNPKKLPINIPIPIISSRACSNQCNFCSMYMVHGRKIRFRSARNIVDEIEFLYNTYNHKYFSFMDDNFTFSKKRTLNICNEIIDRKLDIQFDTPNGVFIKTLDQEVMDTLINAGLVKLCVAPESGSDFIRNKIIHKPLSTKEIYDFFNIAKDYKNLYIKAFFIIGFPEETHETLNETYEMITNIQINQISIFNVIPFPGTPLFENYKNKNVINFSINNLHNLDTFSNYNESNIPFIKPYKLEIEDLINFRKKAYDYINKHNKKIKEIIS